MSAPSLRNLADPTSPRGSLDNANIASAWSDVAWSGGGGGDRASAARDVSVTVAVPPKRPAAAEEPSVWHNVATMDPAELGVLLVKNDFTPPSEHLVAVCSKIESFTNQKAPMRLQQRRIFIKDWVEKMTGGAVTTAAAETPTAERPSTARSASGASATPPSSSRGVFPPSTPRSGGSDAAEYLSVPSKSSQPLSEEELALVQRISSHVDARGTLHVPPDHLPVITSLVATSLGKLKSPPSLSARRRLIDDWYEAAKLRMAASGGGSGGGGGGAASLGGGFSPPPPTTSAAAAAVATASDGGWMPPRPVNVNLLPTMAAAQAPRTPTSPSESLPDVSGPYGGSGLLGAAGGLPAHLPGCSGAWNAPPPSASEVTAHAADVLYRHCQSLDTGGGGALRLAAPEVSEAAMCVSAHTGAKPASTALADLASFVTDWYRWQVHMKRGGVSSHTTLHSGPASPAGGGYGAALSSAAVADISDYEAPRRPPAVPPLGHLAPPSLNERTPGGGAGSESSSLSGFPRSMGGNGLGAGGGGEGGRGGGGGGGLGGWAGAPLQTQETPRSDLNSARSTSSSYAELDELNEEQILDELASTTPPAEMRAFAQAALNGENVMVTLHLSQTRLSVVGKSIELCSGKRCPTLIKQKRDYIGNWWRQALARSAHSSLVHSPQPSTPAKRIDANPLHLGDDGASSNRFSSGGRGAGAPGSGSQIANLTSTQRTALKRLLSEYGEPRLAAEGAIELHVPNEHLLIVCSQVSQLTGQTTPRQPRAKREWLADVSKQVA